MRPSFEREEIDYKQGIKRGLYWLVIGISRSNRYFRLLIDIAALYYYKIFRRNKYIVFRGRRYKYFYHFYNRTVASERVVEIPLAKGVLDEYEGKEILEVGNVMSHYFKLHHDVLDKYEKGRGVINQDVVNFKPESKYDLIISVSTLEHVGYSYGEKWEPEKFSVAIKSLKKILRSGGMLFVTLPIYLNPYISKLILKDKMPFDEEFYLKRETFLNEWKQVNREEAIGVAGYDSYFASSNSIYIGIYKKK